MLRRLITGYNGLLFAAAAKQKIRPAWQGTDPNQINNTLINNAFLPLPPGAGRGDKPAWQLLPACGNTCDDNAY